MKPFSLPANPSNALQPHVMTNFPIYLDGFATLPLAPEARDAMLSAWSQPGNAGSPNLAGEQAARIIDNGRAAVASLIGAATSEITFTSGATEANNLALLGVAAATRSSQPARRRIVISAIEHKSVQEPVRKLQADGFLVTVAPVDGNGLLDLDAFAALLGEDVLLASIMLVNNETGVIQPIEAAAELVHRAGGLVHCDAAQAGGKVAIDVVDLNVDYLSISAHKCYGPMGIGALYSAAGSVRPAPLIFGGGQQASVRPGTEPVALIAGFGAAADAAATGLADDQAHSALLIDRLLDTLSDRQLQFHRITGQAPVVAGSAALLLPGVDGDVLCTVAAKHVSLSTGSACTSGQLKSSHVIEAIGLSDMEARSVVRIFCHRYLEEQDIVAAADQIVGAARRSRLAAGELPQ